jgi:hypothetical protein
MAVLFEKPIKKKLHVMVLHRKACSVWQTISIWYVQAWSIWQKMSNNNHALAALPTAANGEQSRWTPEPERDLVSNCPAYSYNCDLSRNGLTPAREEQGKTSTRAQVSWNKFRTHNKLFVQKYMNSSSNVYVKWHALVNFQCCMPFETLQTLTTLLCKR